MRSRLFILLAALPLAAVSLAAEGEVEEPHCYLVDVEDTPDDLEDDVEACAVETWFHRAATPVGNAEALAAESFPTFDTTPPAGSVAGGNGGGYGGSSIVEIADPGSPTAGARFVGEFEGVIDVIDVTLHGFYNGFGSTGGPTDRRAHTIDLYLTIDGATITGPTEISVATSDFDDPTAAPHQFDFAVTGIAKMIHMYGLDPVGPHTVELTIVPKYINTNPAAIYVYDTTEVPGGIHFNPAEIDPAATVTSLW